MEPIQEPPFVMSFNTIQAIEPPGRRELWTESDIIELYKCYYLAENIKPNGTEEMYNIWRRRNPTIGKEMTTKILINQRILFQID